MKKILYIALLLIAAQGAWAYTPVTIDPPTTHGPWTFDAARCHEWINQNNVEISFNSANEGVWDKKNSNHSHDRIYQWKDNDGLGFTICADASTDSRCLVLSTYYHNEDVPSFTRIRMTWTYTLHVEADDLPVSFVLYHGDDLSQIKDLWVCQDSHYWETNESGPYTLKYLDLDKKNKTVETAQYTNVFDYDNREGDTEQTKQNVLMAVFTAENPEGSSVSSYCNHQWGAFKSYAWSVTSYYYKQFSYAPNGGVGLMNNQEIENSGTLTANAFVRDGYTFVGWATSPNGEKVYDDGAAVTATEDNKGRYVLYAIWKPQPATVVALINAIGETVYTAECKARIDDARAIYNKLSADEQSQVGNYGTLTDAETAYAAVGEVMTKIAAIGEVAYPSSEATIAQAKAAFDALGDPQKAIVINAGVLTTAQAQYAVLEVDAKIGAIGTVAHTAESKELIDAAREAYNALTDGQKTLVTNYATLLAAEATYADLVKTVVLFEDKDAAELKSESKAIVYPELPAGASKWQTVEKDASDKTIVIKAVE